MKIPLEVFLKFVAKFGLDAVVTFRYRLEELGLLNEDEIDNNVALSNFGLARLQTQVPQPSPTVVPFTSCNQRDDLDPLTFDTEPKPGKLDMEALRYR